MTPATETLIADGIQAALPVIIGFVRGFHAGSGQLPTLDQVKGFLAADTTTAVGIDDAWLTAHGMATPTPPAP